MKIGVFDSGIGGEAVARSLRTAFPDAAIKTVNDRAHAPYGSKNQHEVTELTDAAIQPLLDWQCDVLVIACNTATTQALATLRRRYPHQRFVGVEPMIKPAAALTKTGMIAVCATPSTLASERYQHLVKTYASHLTIVEPDCSEWAYMIENNAINHSVIQAQIKDVVARGCDVIVLGCTHYHWIKDVIETASGPGVVVIDPSQAVAKRIGQLLEL